MLLTIIVILLVVAALLVVVSRWGAALAWQNFKPLGRGAYGEMRVASVLSQLPGEYRVFNDVYLESNGYSSQIDHVVISQYGVFVIETKNYSGTVYGNENAEYWSQYLNGERYDFRNPIKQNLSHLWAVRNTLGVAPSSIVPIVVFLRGVILHCDTNSPVVYADQLLGQILGRRTIEFTPDGVERLAQRLSELMVVSADREQKHIQSVNQSVAERERLISNRICPRCRGRLVERQGRYGRFLSCGNYPRCKFTTEV